MVSEQNAPTASHDESKARYEKPELVVVDLKAEEVLAVGCKVIGRAAPGNPNVCMANNCAQRGS